MDNKQIYKIEQTNDVFLEKIYDESIADLNKFYDINWVRNKPRVFIVKDRMTIDALWGATSEPWQIGWSEPSGVYLLDQNSMETESSHKRKNDVAYAIFMKHELSHSFSRIITKIGNKEIKPKWLWEGVAVYTSGELPKKKVETFANFLKYYDQHDKYIYQESGFAIELLIKKFGKSKFLELLKRLTEAKNESEFNLLFKSVYSIELNYENFNNLLKS